MQPEERLHEEELELDDEEENSSISCGGAEEVVGNTHLCCHSQLLQTAMCELVTSNLSVNIASNIGFSGVPHFHWRQRVYAPSVPVDSEPVCLQHHHLGLHFHLRFVRRARRSR